MINYQGRYLIKDPSVHSVIVPTSLFLTTGLPTNLIEEGKHIFQNHAFTQSLTHSFKKKKKSECQAEGIQE